MCDGVSRRVCILELHDLDKSKTLKMLENGVCPFCLRKGFKKILVHISRIHGIPAKELKDNLMIPRNTGFCDEETMGKAQIFTKNQGFGVLIRPSKTRKNQKFDAVSIKKVIEDRKRPERMAIFNKVMAKVDFSKSAKSRSDDAIKRQTLRIHEAHRRYIAATKNDAFYLAYAKRFIEIIKENGRMYGAYKQLSNEFSVKRIDTTRERLKKAETIGLIIKNNQAFKLTSKAIKLLRVGDSE